MFIYLESVSICLPNFYLSNYQREVSRVFSLIYLYFFFTLRRHTLFETGEPFLSYPLNFLTRHHYKTRCHMKVQTVQYPFPDPPTTLPDTKSQQGKPYIFILKKNSLNVCCECNEYLTQRQSQNTVWNPPQEGEKYTKLKEQVNLEIAYLWLLGILSGQQNTLRS